jgi:hypothetical protein
MPTPEEMLTDPHGIFARNFTKFEIVRALAEKHALPNRNLFKTDPALLEFGEFGRRYLLALPYFLEQSALEYMSGIPTDEIEDVLRNARMPSTFTWVSVRYGAEILSVLLHDDRSDKIKIFFSLPGATYMQDASLYPHLPEAHAQSHLQGGQELTYVPDIYYEKSTNLFHFPSPMHRVCTIKGKEDFSLTITTNDHEPDMGLFNTFANVSKTGIFLMAKMTNKGPRDEAIIRSAKQPERSLSRFSVRAGHVPKLKPTPVYVTRNYIKPENERNPDSPATQVLKEPQHVRGYTQTLVAKEVTYERNGKKITYPRKAQEREVQSYLRGAGPGQEVPSVSIRPVRAARTNHDAHAGNGS